jgi:DNA-directed RNA polymerase specialized sigma24 family protein
VATPTHGYHPQAARESPRPAGGDRGPADEGEQILTAIQTLPGRQRMATILFYIDGYSQIKDGVAKTAAL